LLAWSALDPPRLVAQGEKLKELLCNSATHCPHTIVLRSRDSLSSVFGLYVSGGSLAEATLELVREIEARGPSLNRRENYCCSNEKKPRREANRTY